MKKFIFAFLLFILISCTSPDPNTIYWGNDWVVKKVNDTTLICIPQQSDLLGRMKHKPYLLNIKDFSETEFKE